VLSSQREEHPLRDFLSSGFRVRTGLAVAAGLALGLAWIGEAQALPKRSQPVCNCSCDTGPNGVHDMTYAGMPVCGIYNGKTCNVEVSPGIIRSGTLRNCGAGTNWVDMRASAAARAKLSADPTVAQPPASKIPRAPAASTASPRQ